MDAFDWSLHPVGSGLCAGGTRRMDAIRATVSPYAMEARRSTGPLFWMHGDESRQQLERELTNVLNGHNGTFTTEPRPHSDWLGEGWYRDLGICLEFARKNNLTCFIYDDWWWPSQMMGGRVPPQYGSKRLQTASTEVEGGNFFEAAGFSLTNLVAVVAGRVVEGGAIDGSSVTNLTSLIQGEKSHGKRLRGIGK